MPQDKLINGLSVRAGTKDALIAKHFEDLGKVPDSEIASRVGVSARTVAAFRRRQGLHLKRGRTPSKGRDSGKTVRLKTPVELPPEKTEAAEGKKFRTRGPTSKIDPHVRMLGKVPDRQISKLAGVTVNAVAAYRRRRGIAAVGRGASAPVEVKTAAPTVPTPVASIAAAPAVAAPAPVEVAPAAVAPVVAKSAPARPAALVSGSKVYRVELADGSIAYAVANGLGQAGSIAEAAGALGLSYLGPVLG